MNSIMYVFETDKLFISKYSWFYLPVFVHIILTYKTLIFDNNMFPILVYLVDAHGIKLLRILEEITQ